MDAGTVGFGDTLDKTASGNVSTYVDEIAACVRKPVFVCVQVFRAGYGSKRGMQLRRKIAFGRFARTVKEKAMDGTLDKWHMRFLSLAEHISQWSKDPSTKTGAIITDKNNRIVSQGYNGFPRNVSDTPERLGDREMKYKLIVHAEMNALLFARGPVEGYRMYVWPFMPCVRCAVMTIQAGMAEVIAPATDNERWAEDFMLSKALFDEAGVRLNLVNDFENI